MSTRAPCLPTSLNGPLKCSCTLRTINQEKGIALIVALILLVIATLTGLAGMRGTSLQEKMSANLNDRSIAMQSAEAGLAAAYNAITDNPSIGTDCSSSTSNCPIVPANTFVAGDSEGWTSATGINTELQADTPPEYFIQRLGIQENANIKAIQLANCLQYGSPCYEDSLSHLYRVTARSSTPSSNNDRAIVALSSIVRLSINE